jgi:hypothetical protein
MPVKQNLSQWQDNWGDILHYMQSKMDLTQQSKLQDITKPQSVIMFYKNHNQPVSVNSLAVYICT